MHATAPPLLRRLALLWLVLVAGAIVHATWRLVGEGPRLQTDVLAMLPQDAGDRAVADATRALVDAGANRVVVLVRAGDAQRANAAADRFAESLAGLPVTLRQQVDDSADWLDFFTPYRRGLLDDAQRARLRDTPVDTLAASAIASLYRPVGMPRIGAWSDDPLNLLGEWLAARASANRIRVVDGRLAVVDGDVHYAVLLVESRAPAFASGEQAALVAALQRGRGIVAHDFPDSRVHVAGVPLYAAAAAAQAQREVHTIGAGSFLGILLLTWFAFSAIRPRLLVLLSIVVGLVVAFSLTSAVFDRLHLITLVFGATLVGVAENYGASWFSNRIGAAPEQRWAMLRSQWPTMAMAMATTVIGYALLALTPFPGLRQIALFSAVGLIAAFATVLLWFPFLDTRSMPFSRFASWLGGWRARWPRLQRNAPTIAFVAVVAAISIAGLSRLRANDDIRLLQNAPKALLADQQRINALLDLPTGGQFLVISGADAETVLQREEALKPRLDAAVARGDLRGYQAISDWVPSQARQRDNAALVGQIVDGDGGVRVQVARQLDETLAAPATATPAWLDIAQWLAAPVSEPLRSQWLPRFGDGVASIILLRESGIGSSALATIGDPSAGIRYVNKVADVSTLMAHYRSRVGWIIAISYLLVFVALSLRFGRQAWRALLPTALASVLTLALLGLFGQPLQLFNLVALLLVLGMGVDYGIFLLAQPARQLRRPYLSVALAALSTLLAFGLLALSATPALQAFGLTMLFGITLAWLLAPCFLPPDPTPESSSHRC